MKKCPTAHSAYCIAGLQRCLAISQLCMLCVVYCKLHCTYLADFIRKSVPWCTWPLLCYGVHLTSIVSLYVPGPYYVPRCTWPVLCLSMYLAPIMFRGVPDLYCVPLCTWPLLCSAVFLTSVVFRGVPDLYCDPRCTWPLLCPAVYRTSIVILGVYLTSIVYPYVPQYLAPIMFRGVLDLHCFLRCNLIYFVFLCVPDPYYVPRCTWPLLCFAVYQTAYVSSGIYSYLADLARAVYYAGKLFGAYLAGMAGLQTVEGVVVQDCIEFLLLRSAHK